MLGPHTALPSLDVALLCVLMTPMYASSSTITRLYTHTQSQRSLFVVVAFHTSPQILN